MTDHERDVMAPRFLLDLSIADTVAFFDGRVALLRAMGVAEIPGLDALRAAAFSRNVAMLEDDVATAETDGFREMRRAQLRALKRGAR